MNNSQDGQTAFDRNRKPDFAKIEAHYDHAREKHPHFCDKLLPTEAEKPTKADALRELQSVLLVVRQELSDAAGNGELSAFMVHGCEMMEFAESVMMGDTAHAVEECYDAIAVLLRTIDVLEGRQPFGRPKEGVSK